MPRGRKPRRHEDSEDPPAAQAAAAAAKPATALRHYSRTVPPAEELRSVERLGADVEVVAQRVEAAPTPITSEWWLMQIASPLRAMRQEWTAAHTQQHGPLHPRVWWLSLVVGVAARSIDEVRAVLAALQDLALREKGLSDAGTGAVVDVGLLVDACEVYNAAMRDDAALAAVHRHRAEHTRSARPPHCAVADIVIAGEALDVFDFAKCAREGVPTSVVLEVGLRPTEASAEAKRTVLVALAGLLLESSACESTSAVLAKHCRPPPFADPA
uniref:Uncharacterized protein n=1 Tax=Neobodo designis TaxID=312471 RepID=A0A7S1LWI0_NEODS